MCTPPPLPLFPSKHHGELSNSDATGDTVSSAEIAQLSEIGEVRRKARGQGEKLG